MTDNLQEVRTKLLDAAIAAQDFESIEEIRAALVNIGFVELGTKEALAEVKLELFEAQNQIIKLQADAIEELLLITMLHTEIADDDTAKAVEKINEAAQIRAEHQL